MLLLFLSLLLLTIPLQVEPIDSLSKTVLRMCGFSELMLL